VRSKEFDYEWREPPETNWRAYDQAQIKEMANYLDNVRDLVNEANHRIKERTPPKKRGPGRPPIDSADIAKVLLVQEYTHSPNRVAEGLILLFREKLGISQHFSYKTIERGYDREPVNEILDEVERIINECVKGKETAFSFDGTGHSTTNKENYAATRQKQNSKKKTKGEKKSGKRIPDDSFPDSSQPDKKGFTYSVMGVGVRYKLIAGMAVRTDNSVGETRLFPDVFSQIVNNHPGMNEVMGDGKYGVRWITELVSPHAMPYFLPNKNVTFKSKGYSGWGNMLLRLQKDPQDWLRHYHMRSISETVNSMIECRFGGPIRKKLDSRKKTETRLKGVAHDVRRIGYLEIIEGIVPHWPRKGS